MSLSILHAVFANKLESDDRELIQLSFLNEEYGILTPHPMFWTELLVLLALEVLFAIAISILIFKFVIPRRGSTFAYLTGFGVVIPLCLLFPYHVISILDIRNKIHKFCLMISPMISTFRCLEAMFGFSPYKVEHSLSDYILYHATPMELVYDPKTNRPVPATLQNVVDCLKSCGIHFLQMGMFLSLVSPFSYEPFDSKTESNSLDHTIWDLLNLAHLGNNLVGAMLCQMTLTVYCDALRAIITSVCGVQTIEVMNNPLFLAASPSNFWGGRWNMLVHGILKRGVYLPVRKYHSKITGVFFTFLASGLIHEWILSITFYRETDAPFTYGKNLLFFLWNGMVIGLESIFGKAYLFQAMSKTLPKFVITILVILTALPVAHWFTGDLVKSDFFEDGQIGFPMIVRSS